MPNIKDKCHAKIIGEDGQVLVEFAVMIALLVLMLAFAVDFGVTNAAKARLAQVAQQAESECAQPATALAVKNSNRPGDTMTHALVKALRDSGYNGAVTAYYYEPSAAESGLEVNKRVYVYGVTLEDDVRTVFSVGSGAGTIPTSARMWQYSVTYSSERTWRPYDTGSGTPPSPNNNGYLQVKAGDSGESAVLVPVSTLTEDKMPGGRAVLNAAVAEARNK